MPQILDPSNAGSLRPLLWPPFRNDRPKQQRRNTTTANKSLRLNGRSVIWPTRFCQMASCIRAKFKQEVCSNCLPRRQRLFSRDMRLLIFHSAFLRQYCSENPSLPPRSIVLFSGFSARAIASMSSKTSPFSCGKDMEGDLCVITPELRATISMIMTM